MTQKAYLIHGTSTKDDDWFPWLEKAAKPEISLTRIDLPDPFIPVAAAWNQAADMQIPATDGITLVAHSLGCITALRYVARHAIKNINLLLVGAFSDNLPTYPQLNNFMQAGVNWKQITGKIGRATVITAVNDPIAPYQQAVTVAKKIGAKLIVQESGGHFLASDGFTQFPLALKELRRVSQVQ